VTARDPETVLRAVVELTELESALIAERDAPAIVMLCAEREALFSELPATLPPGCAPLRERFVLARDANLLAATAAAATIRAEISANRKARVAIGGYASASRERPTRGEA
jgi:hypothetical protein